MVGGWWLVVGLAKVSTFRVFSFKSSFSSPAWVGLVVQSARLLFSSSRSSSEMVRGGTLSGAAAAGFRAVGLRVAEHLCVSFLQ